MKPRRPPTGTGRARGTPTPARRCEDTRRKPSLSYRDIPEPPKGWGQGNNIISTVSYQLVRSASGLFTRLRRPRETGYATACTQYAGSDPVRRGTGTG